MKLFFKKLTVNNFLSIKRQTIEYEKLNGLSMVIGENEDITGTSNGAGKSSLMITSLLWVIYGKTPVSLKNEHIPNRTLVNFKRLPTKLTLELYSNDKPYTIVTGLHSATGPQYCRLYSGFETKEEHNISKSIVKETRAHIETNILGMSMELFMSCITLTSSSRNDFLMMDKWRKRQYIDEVFGLKIFGALFQEVKRDYNKLNTDILTSIKQKKIYEESTVQLTTKYDDYIENIGSDIINIEKQIVSLQTTLLKEVSENDTQTLKGTIQQKNDLTYKQDDFIEKIRQKKLQIRNIEKDIRYGEKTLAKYDKIMTIVCEDCMPQLDSVLALSEIKENNKTRVNTIDSIKNRLIVTETQLKTIEATIAKIKESITKMQAHHDKLYDNGLRNNYNKEKIITLQKDLIKLEKQENPFGKMLSDANNKCKELTNLLVSFNDKKEQLDIILHITGDNGAKKYILKDIIEIVNTLIAKYLSIMGSSYTILFNEYFEYTLLTESGECSFNNFSSGERARINLAILFSFAELLSVNSHITSNIFIVDEILDTALCDKGFRNCIKILKDKSTVNQLNTVIISHRSGVLNDMKHLFNKKITVSIKHKSTNMSIEDIEII